MKKLGVILMLALAAEARPIVDQQAPYGTETITVGGTNQLIVAQTVTAGAHGDLLRVELTIGCDSGALIVEIVNLHPTRPIPGTVVRSTTTIAAADIPNPPDRRTFDMDRPLAMTDGRQFAIVLRNETGSCTVVKGLDVNPYERGSGWFRGATTSTPDAWLQFLDFGKTDDLGFKTIVNVPVESPPCIVNGFASPFPGWLPVCRCLEDEGLADFRCALFHPDFFLFRNLPLPVKAGEPFIVKWTLVVYAPMQGIVELLDTLPPGFQTTQKVPLKFFVGQIPVGQSLTLEYKAVAPLKAGKYKLETTVAGGQLTTTIEVTPK